MSGLLDTASSVLPVVMLMNGVLEFPVDRCDDEEAWVDWPDAGGLFNEIDKVVD